MTYDRLCEAIKTCKACSLGAGGNGVPGMYVWPEEKERSATAARVGIPLYPLEEMLRPETMVLGEAPGGVEMARGKPFVGQSGELLHSLLKEVGLTSYYVSNIAKHQPPKVKGKQQAPDSSSVEACAPFLRAEFEVVKPTKLILLGKTAAKLAYRTGNFAMKDVVNQTYGFNQYAKIPTLVLYHPSYFLRNRTSPWIQKAVREWKQSVRLFLGDEAPVYQVERVRCETHG